MRDGHLAMSRGAAGSASRAAQSFDFFVLNDTPKEHTISTLSTISGISDKFSGLPVIHEAGNLNYLSVKVSGRRLWSEIGFEMEQINTEQIDESKLNEFVGKMLVDLGRAFCVPIVHIGGELGLYKLLKAHGEG